MWEHHKIKHFKGLAHMNPGGYTYTEGWSQLIKSAVRINDEDTRLREAAAVRAKLDELETQRRGDLFALDSPLKRAALGGFGSVLLIAGLAMALRRRRTA